MNIWLKKKEDLKNRIKASNSRFLKEASELTVRWAKSGLLDGIEDRSLYPWTDNSIAGRSAIVQ